MALALRFPSSSPASSCMSLALFGIERTLGAIVAALSKNVTASFVDSTACCGAIAAIATSYGSFPLVPAFGASYINVYERSIHAVN